MGWMKQVTERVKRIVGRIPVVRTLAPHALRKLRARQFPGSQKYWMERYAKGDDDGPGSCGKLAEFKAEILNSLVKEYGVQSIIEYGCGSGNQLRLARYPEYLGFDVSPEAVSQCRRVFRTDGTKVFKPMKDYAGESAELTLSLDVVYHLVEDGIFESYMRRLFDSSTRFVVIYSSNTDRQERLQPPHVRHREFTRWIDQNITGWKLIKHIPNKYPFTGDINAGSFADFYIYEKT